MKSFLALVFFMAFSLKASANSTLEVDLSKPISPLVEVLLIESFGEQDYQYLKDIAKTNKVLIKVVELSESTSNSSKPAHECEVTIEKESAGGGRLAVDAPVGSVSGGGGGRGSRRITIKGPCKEVAKLLKMAMDDDGS